ncbi:MAG: Grx4 family monothiol glutaredoxin [Gammaproteobacteria bacterium]
MSLADHVRERIEVAVGTAPVVLFMKGSRQQPQCGFSATVVGILDNLVTEYHTVNVLEDPEIREGIKVYSEWPTIPQLYIGGEFVGGCDLVQQMYTSGDLHRALGQDAAEPTVPSIRISDAAADAIRNVRSQHPELAVHLKIDAAFNHEFSLAPAKGHEIRAADNDIEICFDRDSAARAEGLSVDMMQTPEGPGFQISNPSAPPPVGQMPVEELKAKMDAGANLHLFDVREQSERDIAHIQGSVLLDEAAVAMIDKLPRDAMLVFQCHSGVRSQQAAEYFRGQGFTNVHNLVGGIDAWSQAIDPDVPRY